MKAEDPKYLSDFLDTFEKDWKETRIAFQTVSFAPEANEPWVSVEWHDTYTTAVEQGLTGRSKTTGLIIFQVKKQVKSGGGSIYELLGIVNKLRNYLHSKKFSINIMDIETLLLGDKASINIVEVRVSYEHSNG